jgi:hypothetical protein
MLGSVKAVLCYGIALLGLGMVVLSLLKALGTNLSYPSARLMLMNLFRTNPNKAEQVCKSLPGTFFEPLAATIVAIAQTATRDPNVIVQASRPTYDATGKAVVMGFKGHLTKAKIGLGMVVGAIVLSLLLADKPPPTPDDPNYDPTADVVEQPEPGFFDGPGPFIVLGVLAGIGIAWIFARTLELERCIVRARAELLPELERAVVEGRYQFPPKRA